MKPSTIEPNEGLNSTRRPEIGLLVPTNFILGIRELGYVSLPSALSELIDNSLQAGATRIQITIERDQQDQAPTISVADNGTGMTSQELAACLQFGGTQRFNNRDSFGRFGIGLPAASLSQTQRVQVVSWQDSEDPHEVSLDVDQVALGQEPALHPRPLCEKKSTQSGCTVIWHRCDRVEYKRLGWLEKALHRDLGRIYRQFLRNGLDLSINGTSVTEYDPMFLGDGSAIAGAKALPAFEPLRYSVESNTGESFIKVAFSVLPIHPWHKLDNATKRRHRIVGGGGVSILRAGREIAFGWHLLGAKRKENYDDWWRCEISFEPAADEYFGITISKQGIRPSAKLRELLEPDLESIARLLNARVRQEFEQVKFRQESERSCQIAESAEHSLAPMRSKRGRRCEGPIAYELQSQALESPDFFEFSFQENTLSVTLNKDHPAFSALYGPLQLITDGAGLGDLRTAVELFVLSYARSSLSSTTNATLAEWSETYAKMLQKR